MADVIETLKEQGYFAILANHLLDRWLRKIPEQTPFGWYELERDGRTQARVFRVLKEHGYLIVEKPKFWIQTTQSERIFHFVEEIAPTSDVNPAYVRTIDGEPYFDWVYLRVNHKLYIYRHPEKFQLMGYGPDNKSVVPYDAATHQSQCLIKMDRQEYQEQEERNELVNKAGRADLLLEDLGHDLSAECFVDLTDDVEKFDSALEAKIHEVEKLCEKTRERVRDLESQVAQMTSLSSMVRNRGGIKKIAADFKKKHGLSE